MTPTQSITNLKKIALKPNVCEKPGTMGRYREEMDKNVEKLHSVSPEELQKPGKAVCKNLEKSVEKRS